MVELLIAHDAQVDVQVSWHPSDDEPHTGSLLEYGLFLGFREQAEANDDTNGSASRRRHTKEMQDIGSMLVALVAEPREQLRDTVLEVSETHLRIASVMATEEWARVVEKMLDRSMTFEDVSEIVYDGARVSLEDDEGWFCQGWGNYVWFDEILGLLGEKAAVKNPRWLALVERVIKEQEAYDAGLEDDLEAFLELPWVRAHPAFEQISGWASGPTPGD